MVRGEVAVLTHARVKTRERKCYKCYRGLQYLVCQIFTGANAPVFNATQVLPEKLPENEADFFQ